MTVAVPTEAADYLRKHLDMMAGTRANETPFNRSIAALVSVAGARSTTAPEPRTESMASLAVTRASHEAPVVPWVGAGPPRGRRHVAVRPAGPGRHTSRPHPGSVRESPETDGAASAAGKGLSPVARQCDTLNLGLGLADESDPLLPRSQVPQA